MLAHVAGWRGADRPYPRDKNVSQLVEMWAAETPDAIALVVDGREVSYADLNRQANGVASALHHHGAGPETRVAVCLERSAELVGVLLGVLKVGAAYVPIDPAYPPARVAYLLRDSAAKVLVTRQPDHAAMAGRETQVLSLGTGDASLGQPLAENPVRRGHISDVMYVVYTSGSTGQPKGVMVAHDSVLNMVSWHQDAFGLTRTDRTTWLSSPAFDATGWEIWPTLTAGACLAIVDDRVRVDPFALQALLVNEGVTVAFAPTALAEQLIALEWPTTTALRYLLTGADALRRYPPSGLPFVLVNNYGPTEATVLVTSGPVPPVAQPSHPPALGGPIANTQIHLLDGQLRPVPAGEVGEIHIGGRSLAVGYLNRPDLTAERFIRDPFSDDPSARLYKTGDLARQLPDGALGFAGRVDQQIKVRGYRIEPEEIVAVLNRQPAIDASYVMAREDVPGDERVVAYVILATDQPINATALREALRAALPEYMVPATFVRVDAWPCTPNGKIDRDGLPPPDAENAIADPVTTGPVTPIERQLAAIVTGLLQLPAIDIDDNFFMLGGHSMLGTQVIVRVSEAFGVSLPLRTLFEAPSVRDLAARIEGRLREKIAAMSDDEARALLRS